MGILKMSWQHRAEKRHRPYRPCRLDEVEVLKRDLDHAEAIVGVLEVVAVLEGEPAALFGLLAEALLQVFDAAVMVLDGLRMDRVLRAGRAAG